MGKIRIYAPIKIVAALTTNPTVPIEEIAQKLEELLSPIDMRSPLFPFNFTDYYTAEMGSGLKKQFLSFKKLVHAETLPEIKIATNIIEDNYKNPDKRSVNIDPGYICAAKLILATTKDYDHRLYLSRGIFGDVHLRFRKGHFRVNEWTYPDYRQPEILNYFEMVRSLYLEQL